MNTVTGTGQLIRLSLRRDRVLLPVWIAVFALLAAVSAAATVGLYPTVESRVRAAAGLNAIPSLVALYGPVYDPTSLGALSMLKLGVFGAALVAVLAMVTVIRHTRAEEEAGRLELLGATVVGRSAALTAGLVVTTGGCLLLGLLTTLGLVAAGLPIPGSVAFGLSWSAVGVAFAAVAACAAQLTRSARAAKGIGLGVLGAAYLLRAIGDASGARGTGWLSWLSPLGWGQQMRAFAGDRWWVVGLLVAFAGLVTAGAYGLLSRRDVDAGLLAERPGPASGAARLRTPLALAWRLQRGVFLGWAAAFLVGGVVVGSIAAGIGGMLDSPQARDMIIALGGPQRLTDAFLAAELGILGVIVSGYGVQAALRLRSEELALRAEPVLVTSVGRIRWALGHTAIALLGATALLAVAGLGAGVAHGAQVGDLGRVGPVFVAALARLPAAWVLTGLVVALFGLAPRLVLGAWAVLAGFLLLGEFGTLLQLDPRLIDLSPFTHVPKLPGGELTMTPLMWLTLVALVLTAAGLAGFRRRDIG